MPQEQLYGVWYNQQNRWARLYLPDELRLKYMRSYTHLPHLMFFPKAEVDQIISRTYSIPGIETYSIQPDTYTGLTPEEEAAQQEKIRQEQERQLDQQRRQEHANKYL